MRQLGLITIIFGAITFAACGGNDAAPSIITGGGVSSGEIDGRVNVYVIDGDTDAPISGAKVRVGKIDGTTDATGLFIAKGDLNGKQNIAAVATGHVPALWVGVNGANVTIPVDVTASPTVAQAELDGGIDNWATLPAPAQGHATLATVLYTQTSDFGAPENSIQQPTQGGVAPANICLNSQFGNPGCAFKVNARTGAVGLFATITDRDLKGTPTDLADDSATVTGFAFKGGLAVNGGVNQQGLTLTSVAAGDTVTAKVDFGTPPAALPTVGSLFYVDFGGDGIGLVVRDPLNPLGTLTPAQNTVLAPKTSAFAGSSYRLIAAAQTSGGNAQSLINKHGLTDVTNVVLGDWLPTPTGITFAADVVSTAAVSGANLISFDLTHASAADKSWTCTIFDGSLTATIPVDLAPIASGSNTLKANAIDASIDVNDFSIDTIFDKVNRLSSDQVTFTK